jgi:Flp pilus assembly protein TadD
VYEAVLAAHGGNDYILNNLAALLLDTRSDPASHARALQLVSGFEKSATHPFQLGVLGWAYYRNGQNANALRLLQRANSGNAGDNPQLRYFLGMARLKAGDEAGAREDLRRAVEAADATHTSFTGLAEARSTLEKLAAHRA